MPDSQPKRDDSLSSEVKDVILLAANARYAHTAYALRCLYGTLPSALQARTQMLELTYNQDPSEVAYQLLRFKPRIVALSVYLWSLHFMRQLAKILKTLRPKLKLIVGGPEVAEVERRKAEPLFQLADHCILGEGEAIFAPLIETLLNGHEHFPKILHPAPLPPAQLPFVYDHYSDEDLRQRIVYVESSRGCPYRCAFCLSANERSVRYFDLDALFAEFQKLLARGLRSFKFLDRTLNASLERALKILAFFEKQALPELSLHFEMVPHAIPEALLEALAKFPPASIQIEFGVQSLNPKVAESIQRPLDSERLLENLRRLRKQSSVHIHADLIAGLPHETLESFAEGFDQLYQTGVQEIQLGILKRLYGSPLDKNAEALGLLFSTEAPYEILQTPSLSFEELMDLKRMAKYWDSLVNHAQYPQTVAAICQDGRDGYFWPFLALTRWLYARLGACHGISQTRWVALLFDYLREHCQRDAESAARLLLEDYLRARKEDIPPVLRPHLPPELKLGDFRRQILGSDKGHQRQARHAELSQAEAPSCPAPSAFPNAPKLPSSP